MCLVKKALPVIMEKIICFFAVLFILILHPFNLNCVQTQESENLFLAENAYKDGIYDVAEKQLKKILTDNPKSPDSAKIKFLLAKTLYKAKKLAEADKYFKLFSGEKENEFREESLFYLIKSSREQEKFGRCVRYYDFFVLHYPDSRLLPNVFLDAAIAEFNLGNYQKSISLCDFIINSCDDKQSLITALLFKIKSLFALEQFDKSLSLAEKFLSDYPESDFCAEIIFICAESNYQLKNYAESAGYYEKFVSSDIDAQKNQFFEIAMLHYAKSAGNLGDHDMSLEILDKLQKLYPNSKYKSELFRFYAESAYENKNYRLCADYARNYLSESKEGKQDIHILFLLAKSLMELNQISQAEEIFLKVLNILPDKRMLSEAYYGIGCCKFLKGDYESGILYFRQSILNSADEKFSEKCKMAIADSYFELKNYKNALSAYTKTLNIAGLDANLYKKAIFQCARSSFYLKKFDDSLEYFKSLSEKYPDSEYEPEIRYYRGCIYFSRGMNQKTIGELNEFAGLYPKSDRIDSANLICALAYYNICDYDSALGKLSLVSAESDLAAQCGYEKGRCYFQKNEDAKAYDQFSETVQSYPDSPYAPDSLFWLVEYHYNKGELDKAYDFLKQIIEKYPESRFYKESLYYIARCAYFKKNYEESENYIGAFLKKYSDSDLLVEALLLSAQINLAKKEYREADNDISRILEESPHSYLINETYVIKGDILFAQKKYADAVNAYLHVTETNDKELAARAWYFIGKSYMEQRIGSKGIEAMLRVVYNYSDYKIWFYQACFDAAVYYDQREKYDRAKTLYKKMLRESQGDKILPELIEDAKGRLNKIREKQKN